MNELQVFNSDEFGNIRTINVENEPWFVATDVCNALSIHNVTQAVQKLDDDERSMFNIGRQGNANCVNEYGLYSLVLTSRKPKAKEFKRWITHDVIPSIRKHGGYIYGQESMTDDELLAKALVVAQNKIAERDRLIAEKQKDIERMRPKEIFADAVATSNQSILIGQLAKLICQNGHPIGQNRLFQWLRTNGYLMKYGSNYNMPMQRYVEQGLFEVKESSITNPDGSVKLTRTTKVTGKGQQYFINKFLNKEGRRTE